MKSYRLLISLIIVVAFSLGFSPKVVKMVDNINTPGFSTYAPVLSPDGEVLYFTSDRPGGMGAQDIWVSHFVNGQWTE
jgi:Tol biopolymer transport system component